VILPAVRAEDFPRTPRGGTRQVPAGYCAYYPAPLPPGIDYNDELVRELDEATGALHRLGGVGRLLPNPNLLIAPYVRLEAVLSSRIEGTQSDVADLLRYEAGDAESLGELSDDVQEVRNYITALDHGIARLRSGFPLSLRLLRETHERLMTSVRGGHATPGEFRRSQNWIGGSSPSDAAFVPPPVEALAEALDEFELFLHNRSLPLLIHLAMAHYQFEVIHPFLDGNGRLGRLLIPLVLIERRVLPQPLLYLSVYFERNRNQYYDLLMATSRTGDLVPWIRFFLRGVTEQANDAEERTVRLVELQAAVRGELLAERTPMTAVRTAELLFSKPYISASSLATDLDVTFPTAQSAIDLLVTRGDLVEATGRKRNRFYFSQRIFDAVYGIGPATQPDHPNLFDA
jgi:Fic family protein